MLSTVIVHYLKLINEFSLCVKTYCDFIGVTKLLLKKIF